MRVLRAGLALASSFAVLAGVTAVAAPAPAVPRPKQEVLTIQRTATSGLAALALVGRVHLDDTPGFLGIVDRRRTSTRLVTSVDVGGPARISQYGQGTDSPLCGAPVVCTLDEGARTMTFSLTETDDADLRSSAWTGLTRYLALEGSRIDLEVAAVGFTVKRHTTARFARVTREAADGDGLNAYGVGGEVFRGASLAGGPRGSFAALQLPCEWEGAGAMTFQSQAQPTTGVYLCTPQTFNVGATATGASVEPSNPRHGLHTLSSDVATTWRASGLVTGVSGSRTRLFVLSY